MPRTIRDLLLFVAGILGMGYETIARKASDPTLVMAFLGMIGVPFIMRKDEHNQETRDRDRDDDPPVRRPRRREPIKSVPTRQPVKRQHREPR